MHRLAARFAQRFLERSLAGACEAAVPSEGAPCEPAVLLHDAYGAGIALDGTVLIGTTPAGTAPAGTTPSPRGLLSLLAPQAARSPPAPRA